MGTRIVIVEGHPDPAGNRYCHALAQAYADGAQQAGLQVQCIDVANLAFPLLRTQAEFEGGEVSPSIAAAQEAIRWADHLVVIYPLWLGLMPSLLKGFFEQVFRPGFAMQTGERGWRALLKGRSARIIITMGMPAFVYRWYFGAHGLKGLKRSILRFVGIKPIRVTLIGMIGSMSAKKRAAWLDQMRRLGSRGS